MLLLSTAQQFPFYTILCYTDLNNYLEWNLMSIAADVLQSYRKDLEFYERRLLNS